MSNQYDPAITPRNGHTLAVGIVARISGCTNQKELSLDDQVAHAKEVVADRYDGPVDYRIIATKGKGERLDRPELARIEAMLRSGELDVLIAEDIGRIIRGAEAMALCGIAVDHGTRVLAPDDCIDTADANWEEDVISACRDHVGHNSHTSKRIKHKKMNRFKKFGGATPCEIFGYLKPPEAKTYDDWRKEEAATPVYREWLRLLSTTLNCSAVADRLNAQGVPVGPHCRRTTWDGAMVRRITGNPLLKGMPGRGFMHTVKHHETGRRVSVKNPDGPVYREHPHLAFWGPAEFDEINARLDDANKGVGRKPVNGLDPRCRVPRSRTRFPGQHARCWYCGHLAVWGGNGITDNLMCNQARHWHCWNSMGFTGAKVVELVAAALTAELARLDGFDDQLRELVELAGREGGTDLPRSWAELGRDEDTVNRKEKNTRDAIAEYGPDPMFKTTLAELDQKRRELARRRRELESRATRALKLPGSAAELRALFAETFRDLARDSYEFSDLLRLIVPEFHVYLVRLCDGGHLLPRARVVLNLAGLVPDARHVPGFERLLTRVMTLDLFEPPQREQTRADAVRLAGLGHDQREIARQLKVTQPVVSKAMILDRMMREKGLDSPYELVTEPPSDYTKLSRHLNAKYRFEALEGYQRPEI